MNDHAVIIAGGGPTGLMLAGELALAGIDAAIVERRATSDLVGSRAGGLHARTLEVFDQRGIADRFVTEGQPAQVYGFAGRMFDISGFPTRYPYGLGLWQNRIEPILAGWVGELGVPIYREREVTGFTADGSGVDVTLRDGQSLRADYLVGCDGGRSVIRKIAGIAFPGADATISNITGEVEMTEKPELGIRHSGNGINALGREKYEIRDGKPVFADEGPVRVLLTERHIGSGEPTLDELKAALIDVYGTDFGAHSPSWITRFTDVTRQAAAYRQGRVLLAGDAAHVHYPAGGQGLNLGVQDAVNLGWKLAQVVRGTSPESLLDSYHAERHPVGARVLQTTMAAGALQRPGLRVDAMRNVVADLLSTGEAQARLAGMLSGLDLRYDFGEGHQLMGRRMPDLDLITAGGPIRVFTLLHDARPVLINFGAPGAIDIGGWADRVQMIDASYTGTWELPVIGTVPSPAAVLIRPDGYVAWAGEGRLDALSEALTMWFGEAAAGAN